MKNLLTLLIFLQILLLISCTGVTPNLPGNIKNLKTEQILPKCLPASEMSKALFQGFRETISASAILETNKKIPAKMLVLFYTSNRGSFTVTLTGKNQISCAILWGSDYSTEEPQGGIKI